MAFVKQFPKCTKVPSRACYTTYGALKRTLMEWNGSSLKKISRGRFCSRWAEGCVFKVNERDSSCFVRKWSPTGSGSVARFPLAEFNRPVSLT